MSEKLDEIAERATNELHTPGKTKRKPNGSTFRTVRAALAEADADVERLRGLATRLAIGLIDANRLDYPWKDGSRASKAFDEAMALRGEGEK